MAGKNSYFDSHFHPVFKQFISNYEEVYPSKRTVQDLVGDIDIQMGIMELADELKLHILQSQCSVSQVSKGNVQLGIAGICTLEYGIADSRGFIAKVLKSKMTRPLDIRYFDKVKNGQISYYYLMLKELDLYRALARGGDVKPFRLLSRKTPADLENIKGIAVAFALEGGHTLSRTLVGTHNLDPALSANPADPFLKDTGADPVASLKEFHKALWDADLDLCYITLAHLTYIPEQPLATHAFGLKLLEHPAFYPQGNGITQAGFDVIEAAYNMRAKVNGKEVSTPVIIDIKHMSLKSRQDLYAYREAHPEYAKIPLIASHMGVTGYSLAEWKDALIEEESDIYNDGSVKAVSITTEKKKAGEWGAINKSFTFNPWSINMMDDDIVKVLESDGLIGVSLDVRILGFQDATQKAKENEEFISLQDFKTHFPGSLIKGKPVESYESMQAQESWLVPKKEERHPLCLCFNILHIVSAGKQFTSIDPWKHMCIGSDFDGLIDPVKICSDASAMPDLEMVLQKWLPVAEEAYLKENGGPKLIPRKGNDIDYDQLRAVIRDVLFNNGKNFMKRWLKGDMKAEQKFIQLPEAANIKPQKKTVVK